MRIHKQPEEAGGAHEAQTPFAPTIKSLHSEARPREKALSKGIESLTTPELMALVIGSGTKGYNVLQVCTDLMERNDHHLSELARRHYKQLLEVRGLGPSKALQIMAVLELGKRLQREGMPERTRVTSSAHAYALMKPEIAFLDHEEIWLILLNRSLHVVKLYQASKGGLSSTYFDIASVVKEALLENASSVMLAHNHPSGTLSPSPQDDNITTRCRKAMELVGINLVDHIIVTPDGYYSYADHGRL